MVWKMNYKRKQSAFSISAPTKVPTNKQSRKNRILQDIYKFAGKIRSELLVQWIEILLNGWLLLKEMFQGDVWRK